MGKEFKESEIQTNGNTYATYGLFGGAPYSEIEYLNSPITPIENLKRFYQGKDYYWIPDVYADIYEISPDINPDCVAMGYEGGIDSIGVEWEAIENGLPALVRPGHPPIKDIADWRKLNWSDIDAWDWESSAKNYLEVADHSRIFRGVIPTALFERLIDALNFDGAAMSLLTDPEETGAFLDRAADFDIAVMEQYVKYHKVDAIFISDDWASQRAPFFSSDVTKNLLLPRLKRIADRAHELGCLITLHSCGNGIAHIPVFIEAGIDAWQFQESAVDKEEALQLAGDKLKLEGYWIVPEGYDEMQTEEFIYNIMNSYCKKGQMLVSFCDANYVVSPFIRKTVYKIGRQIVSEMKA